MDMAKIWLKIWSKIDQFVASFGMNKDELAQLGHLSVAYGLAYTALTLNFIAGCVVMGLIGGPWVIWKEAIRDPKPPENAPFWWNGAKDAAFYWLGLGLAYAMYKVFLYKLCHVL